MVEQSSETVEGDNHHKITGTKRTEHFVKDRQ